MMRTLLNKLKNITVSLVAFAIVTPSSAAEIITYYHNDISGTPILATDASGNVLWKENYRPYGDKINRQPASSGNGIGFHGKPFDDNAGLSYMGARYYDPVIGRFTGVDPQGVDPTSIHSFGRYTYANNNPYKYVDPDGKAALVATVLPVIVVALVYYGSRTPAEKQRLERSTSQAVQKTSELINSSKSVIFNEKAPEPEKTGGADSAGPKIHEGQQGKHVPGHNNFQPGKSELTDPDPQGLLDQGAGTGQQVGNTPVGQPGSKERVDFGKNIGNYVDPVTGEKSPTSVGIIHNGSRGSHIVPARPGQ